MKHAIIYIPGHGADWPSSQVRAISLWRYRGVHTEVCSMRWMTQGTWANKLNQLYKRIHDLNDQGYKITLVGASAGATAALVALHHKPELINAVVLVCGKSQHPETVSPLRYKAYPAFRQAIQESAKTVGKLTAKQKAKILNLHPIRDGLVPVKETKIAGVKNSIIPIIGHAPGIAMAITLWSWRIVRFARKQARSS